ncbi:hypothetical protein APT65_00122 [Trabzonvirus APT65]|uniref:Uncharacterized protein n=1 Tax=Aeromonas phage APT65 TaxID=2982914 RepID=A0A9E8GAB0_9CAUD|nr:hypothetical protein APT65_00122 [Aeromonas phage APT65]
MINLVGDNTCEGIKLKRQKIVKVLGEIEYHSGREYPWLGKQGCVCQFFETREEAIKFASGGD